jgi:hypothetical protein
VHTKLTQSTVCLVREVGSCDLRLLWANTSLIAYKHAFTNMYYGPPSEPSATFTKSYHLDQMTAEPIARNQFWCDNCMRYFSSSYNLQRHQRKTINACHFNNNTVMPWKIIDTLTGQLRYWTPDEQRDLAHLQKIRCYWDPQYEHHG